jgi:hypothetical protein
MEWTPASNEHNVAMLKESTKHVKFGQMSSTVFLKVRKYWKPDVASIAISWLLF